MDDYRANLDRMVLEHVDVSGSGRYCVLCAEILGKRILCETASCPWCGHNRTAKVSA